MTTATFTAVSDNLKHGAKIAGSEQARQILISAIRKALGKSYPDFFNTEIGRLAEELLVPSVVHFLAMEYTFMPRSETVARVAEYCMQGTGRETMTMLLRQLEPAFEKISQISTMESGREEKRGDQEKKESGGDEKEKTKK